MKNTRYYNQIEAARFIGVSRQAVQQRFGAQFTTVGVNGARHQSRIPEAALIRWRQERHEAAKKLLASGTRSPEPHPPTGNPVR